LAVDYRLQGISHQEDAAVIALCRHCIAAAIGLCITPALQAQQPAQLGVAPAPAIAKAGKPSANQQIADTIGEHLRQSGNLRHYTLHVTVQDGVAELTGSVADQPQREEAIRIVQGIPGVDVVRDRVVVSGPVKQTQALEAPPPLAEPAPLPRKEGEVMPPPAGAIGPEPTPLAASAPSPYDLNPPRMPPYAWPTYAPYNNYSRVAYPTLYPYQSWPYIGPVYPFPKVPLGWRKVKLEWQDGKWWYSAHSNSHDWWRLRYW
jgi:hypothetical protein